MSGAVGPPGLRNEPPVEKSSGGSFYLTRKEKTVEKKKEYVTVSRSMVSNLDLIGQLKEGISYYEKLIKRAQKSLVSYIKKRRLQDSTIRGINYEGNFMTKQNERISKTILKEMLSENLIKKCTVKSKKYEWVKTSRIKPSRKK